MDSKLVSDVIEKLKQDYRNDEDLNVVHGKVHDYLGMRLNFTDAGKVMFLIEQYIELILQNVPEDMKGTATSLAADHLFKTRKNLEFLDKKMADQFYHITTQLLFVCKRARPDIQTAVSFLRTKVQCLDTDDYKKLISVIRYLQ